MTRTRTPLRPLALLAGAVAATLAAVLGVSAAATAEGVVIFDQPTADYRLVLTQWEDDYVTADITNYTGADTTWGLAADLTVLGSRTPLWTDDRLGELGTLTVAAGATAHYSLIPVWPGQRLSFYTGVPGNPVLQEEFRYDGTFLPVDVAVHPDGSLARMQLGYQPSISPVIARIGERPYISVSGMPDGDYDVYLTPADKVQNSLSDFHDLWVPVPESILIASDVASSSGLLSLSFEVLPGTTFGDYAITIGDPDTNWWPVGPTLTGDEGAPAFESANFAVEDGDPRSTTGEGDDVVVTPLDQFGQMPVTLTFGHVESAGSTTVVTTTDGPPPSGFQTVGGPYYEIESDALFDQARVCVPYDTADWVEEEELWLDLRLFHYDGSAWETLEDDPAFTPVFGTVCGMTTGFSPFVVGLPDPAPVVWPFEGFLAPVANSTVNGEFAGSIIPFRFRVGENRGLDILAGSPTSQRVNCTTRAPIGSPEVATSALRAELTYVRASNTYWYFWQTPTSWAGQCRTFSMTLDDGSVHTATFSFKKLTLGGLLKAILKAF